MRLSLLLAGVTLLCGAALGWGGATMINNFRNRPDDIQPASVAGRAADILPSATAVSVEIDPLLDNAGATITLPEFPEPRTAKPIVVAVNGAVRRPGVYDFEKDARVHDGIRAAGGTTKEADLDDINIAARLMDNTSLYVPFRMFRHQEQQRLVARRTPTARESNPPRYTRSGWIHGAPPGIPSTTPAPVERPPVERPPDVPVQSGTTSAASTGGLMNLNTATLAELQQLPGIGPKTAEKIDAYRQLHPFRSVDELMEVHGIGTQRLEAVRNLVTAE